MKDNIIVDKTYAFASRIVKLHKYLTQEQREYVLSKQILRSGTSIGANVEEAVAASSRTDFIHKLTIAAKEACETAYWLRLLHDNDYLPTPIFHSVYQEIDEIKRIIGSIVISTKSTNAIP
ncbi:four helix bundle protein [Hymenobacter artigasi]|uniref:Four helix bundle protein n=1 Tax=Hymenobacter artigasi TaxID=2719616 RepID=A0ABX1HHP7_9BACT|nr:four helix bundle protein [Hymenobacter artigasi]NKI89773.1 four helix bundle protein [Hymenobacter artigasi]